MPWTDGKKKAYPFGRTLILPQYRSKNRDREITHSQSALDTKWAGGCEDLRAASSVLNIADMLVWWRGHNS